MQTTSARRRGRRATSAGAPSPGPRRVKPSLRYASSDPDAASAARVFPGVLATLLVVLACWGGVWLRERVFAPAERPAPLHAPEALFDVGEARRHLLVLASKPRWVGSAALDYGLRYVLGVAEAATAEAGRNGLRLEAELFDASGVLSASVGNIRQWVSYRDAPSVVVRLTPKGYVPPEGGERDTLLVNAHVDSAWGAPGASDTVVGVSAALESLSALASTPLGGRQLVRPVVFLFNGAEEPLLAGSHGFVTTHRWASTIAAHVNLESMGSGMAYILFNVGPGNAWLMDAYRRAVKKPFASAAGADIFQSRVVPAETDFRVFKEAGIPGYDFALIDNGYVYHTKYDDIDHVEDNSLLYGGLEVTLPLVMELAGPGDAIGKHLNGPPDQVPGSVLDTVASFAKTVAYHLKPSLRSAPERSVWFDISGYVLVLYPEYAHFFLLWGMVALSVVVWVSPVFGASVRGAARLSHTQVMVIKVRMLVTILLVVAVGMGAAYSASRIYVFALERPLPWYSSARFALAVFGIPTLLGAMVAMQLSLPTCNAAVSHMCMLHSCALSYSLLSAFVYWNGLILSYVPMVLSGLYFLVGVIPQTAPLGVFVRFIAFLIPQSLLSMGPFMDVLRVFLPLCGRIGDAPADAVAAAVVAFQTLTQGIIHLMPVLVFYRASIARIRRHALVLTVLTGAFVALLPELTLPHRDAVYSKNGPKRVLAFHFHSPSQEPQNLVVLGSMDPIAVDVNTTVRMLPFSDKDALDEIPTWSVLGSNVGECVRPYFKFMSNWRAFEVDERVQLAVPSASIVEETLDEDEGMAHLSIAIRAPESFQTSLRVPVTGPYGVVRAWSLSDELDDNGDEGGMWVRHVGGSSSGASMMDFSVSVKIDPATGSRPPVVFDVSAARPGVSKSAYLQQLYFPQWVAPVFIETTGASFSL